MSETCSGGCHTGDFADFDHYCCENKITPAEAGAAFGAWLNSISGWDGKMEKVEGQSE